MGARASPHCVAALLLRARALILVRAAVGRAGWGCVLTWYSGAVMFAGSIMCKIGVTGQGADCLPSVDRHRERNARTASRKAP